MQQRRGCWHELGYIAQLILLAVAIGAVILKLFGG